MFSGQSQWFLYNGKNLQLNIPDDHVTNFNKKVWW